MTDELDLILRRLAHDLRAPVRGIRGFTRLANAKLTGDSDPAIGEYLGYVDQCATHMGDLIDGMSAFGRAGHDLRLEQVSVADCWEEALAAVGDKAEGATITVTSDLPTVRADKRALVSVLEHLLRNALLYRRDAPAVSLTACEEGEGWQLTVRDQGMGIDPEYHEVVFELLRRLHTRDEYPGVGVGLALCRKVIEAHQGRIWLESELGQGTAVHVWLPR